MDSWGDGRADHAVRTQLTAVLEAAGDVVGPVNGDVGLQLYIT